MKTHVLEWKLSNIRNIKALKLRILKWVAKLKTIRISFYKQMWNKCPLIYGECIRNCIIYHSKEGSGCVPSRFMIKEYLNIVLEMIDLSATVTVRANFADGFCLVCQWRCCIVTWKVSVNIMAANWSKIFDSWRTQVPYVSLLLRLFCTQSLQSCLMLFISLPQY